MKTVKNELENMTLREVMEAYMNARPLRERTKFCYQQVLNHRLGDWLDLPITKISKKMVAEKHKYISTVGTPWKPSKQHANLSMRILKSILNWASVTYGDEEGKPLLSANPVSRLSKTRAWNKIPARGAVMPQEKLRDWYESVNTICRSNTRDYLLLILFTGLRKSEAASLTWANVDFDGRFLMILREDELGDQRLRKLPLSNFAYDLLKKRFNVHESEFVFPGKSGHMGHFPDVLVRLRRQCGFYFSLNDLRRTFITTGEELNITHRDLKRLMNFPYTPEGDFDSNAIEFEELRHLMEAISMRLVDAMDIHRVREGNDMRISDPHKTGTGDAFVMNQKSTSSIQS